MYVQASGTLNRLTMHSVHGPAVAYGHRCWSLDLFAPTDNMPFQPENHVEIGMQG